MATANFARVTRHFIGQQNAAVIAKLCDVEHSTREIDQLIASMNINDQ